MKILFLVFLFISGAHAHIHPPQLKSFTKLERLIGEAPMVCEKKYVAFLYEDLIRDLVIHKVPDARLKRSGIIQYLSCDKADLFPEDE